MTDRLDLALAPRRPGAHRRDSHGQCSGAARRGDAAEGPAGHGGRAVAADRRDLDRVGPDDDGDVVLECATAAGYRALEVRPRITVPASREAWKRFATTRTTEDIAAARVAVDPLLAGAGAKP